MKEVVGCTLVAAVLAACGGGLPALPTLEGQLPLVVAHRGASGYLPEETVEAYAKAIELGADAIEPDVISTKDGVLIARHDPNLAYSTDVAQHPEFASRKRTLSVDGEMQEGWFASDFTLAEIKTLGGISTDAERPQQFNGKFRIATIQEVIDLVKKSGRNIAIYPETKNPSFHRQQGLPLEDKLLALLAAAGWTERDAPVFVQSFEPGSLKYMRSKGSRLKMVQLIDADDVDLKTGALTYAAPYDKPFDWALAGDKRKFSDMVTPAGLAEIKTYADGIGPWKRYIVSVKGTLDANGKVADVNGDGKVNDADTTTMAPTTLVADAHKAGLLVHPYTFRNEKRRLASNYKGDPVLEYKQFFALGVDGLFSDFADTALAARAEYLKETGR
ncbi:glycerophosphodiester phosphodiesterase [Pseudoduganella violaceinigra]|uniref:glycerophosphodiester phosphodiesterase n=1 Tax=Pseudoduganella violaceinigra TaxID=246602 RepID=UPI00040FEF04|nr:glycerophosphodiester phosphodiesterase [Pseudoduganella violaceinigra]